MQRSSPTRQMESAGPRRVRFARKLFASLLVIQLPGIYAAAQPHKPTEFDAKAAYLLNFGRFVRSSESSFPRSSFDICVLGRDPMGASLEAIASNVRINNLPVRIDHPGDVTAAKSCAILFLGSTESDRIREDLAILGNSEILTVSDAPDFLQHGGMIQFVLISHRVRFAVNLEAVSRAHLILSSELLRVASSVSGKPPTGELP